MAQLTVFLLLIAISHLPAETEAEEYRRVLGYTEPYRSIEMTAAESGLISKVHVEEGDEVRSGDPILSLDTTVLEAQLAIARIQADSTAAIAVATAEVNVARERYGKLSRLQRSGTAHSTEVIQASAELKKAEGNLQMAKEEKSIAQGRVREIEAQIERRILRSPIDGIILEINRDLAESADSAVPGERAQALAKVARLDKLRLVVHLPADLIGDLGAGDSVRVLILRENSLQTDRFGSGVEVTGEVEFLSPAIDPSSETVRARIVIDNSEGGHRSGSHAYVLLPAAGDVLSRVAPNRENDE